MAIIAWDRNSEPKFQVLTTFTPLDKDLTRATFKMLFGTVKECGKIRPFATEKNEENFDKLEAELLRM